ncbi:cation-binding protein [Candidatus Woesearchaeota archaeon]|nr:cation-binding protein [Candidatus Woesearchaeota archaeon]
MKPYGPLMVEHRLIERMVGVLKKRKKIDDDLIKKTVDFFRNYADNRHHGKEEKILFKRLEKKDMTPGLKKIMKRLIKEHEQGRAIIKSLEKNDKDAKKLIKDLIKLYPPHIDTEDNDFFLPCMQYLSEKEQKKMVDEYKKVDKKYPESKYRKMVEQLIK